MKRYSPACKTLWTVREHCRDPGVPHEYGICRLFQSQEANAKKLGDEDRNSLSELRGWAIQTALQKASSEIGGEGRVWSPEAFDFYDIAEFRQGVFDTDIKVVNATHVEWKEGFLHGVQEKGGFCVRFDIPLGEFGMFTRHHASHNDTKGQLCYIPQGSVLVGPHYTRDSC